MASLGLHVFLGPDRPRKLQRIQELERALRINPLDRHHVDGARLASTELVALCRQRPAASPARLIVVEEAHRLEAACVEALLHHAGTIAESACVVLLVDTELSVRHPIVRAGSAMATERFAGREAPSAKPFALVEALGRGDVPAALQALREQAAMGNEPLKLVGLIAWQIQRWIAVRRWLDARRPLTDIASLTGMQPWQVERASTEVAGRTTTSLGHMLERCWELDTDAKSGRILPWIAVEQLVFELCFERNGEGREAATPLRARG